MSQRYASVPPDPDSLEAEASNVMGVFIPTVAGGAARAAVGGVRPVALLKLPIVSMNAVFPASATTFDGVRIVGTTCEGWIPRALPGVAASVISEPAGSNQNLNL
jgi:hypothetical protein